MTGVHCRCSLPVAILPASDALISCVGVALACSAITQLASWNIKKVAPIDRDQTHQLLVTLTIGVTPGMPAWNQAVQCHGGSACGTPAAT